MLILVANVREKSILLLQLARLALLQSSPPRTLQNAAANAAWELLEGVFPTRRRRPRWLSPFRSSALTTWVPST
jgi:hypothetical protein